MVNIFVYTTFALVFMAACLVGFSSVRDLIIKGNIKKMLLKNIPKLLCITPCLIILGAAFINGAIMIFGGTSFIKISEKLSNLCCISGIWISGILIGLGLLIVLGGSVLKLIKRRRRRLN